MILPKVYRCIPVEDGWLLLSPLKVEQVYPPQKVFNDPPKSGLRWRWEKFRYGETIARHLWRRRVGLSYICPAMRMKLTGDFDQVPLNDIGINPA